MVDHSTLAAAFASSGFVLYPTTYPEVDVVLIARAA
jgi:hypothetical protein